MKKTIFTLAMATTLLAGTIFTGCQSSDAKMKDAQVDVKDAKQDLVQVKKDADEAAKTEEWKVFRSESEIKIRENEMRIAELREKMKSSGKTLDAVRAKRIDELEQKNRDMKTKINIYEKNQSEWETFKREFNHDMDELGQAFKDLTVDNKK